MFCPLDRHECPFVMRNVVLLHLKFKAIRLYVGKLKKPLKYFNLFNMEEATEQKHLFSLVLTFCPNCDFSQKFDFNLTIQTLI